MSWLPVWKVRVQRSYLGIRQDGHVPTHCGRSDRPNLRPIADIHESNATRCRCLLSRLTNRKVVVS